MQLYSVNLSPFAARVRAAIYAKGADIAIVPPPASGIKSPEYLALNPMGRIPVLQLDDGSTLPESETILEYIEDKFPAKPLRPGTPEAAAKGRLLARVADLYVLTHLFTLFPHMNPKTRDQAVVDAECEKLDAGLGYLDGFLGEGPYALGDSLSAADCTLIPTLFFVGVAAQALGKPELVSGHPKLAAYMGALQKDAIAQKVTAELQAALMERLAQAA